MSERRLRPENALADAIAALERMRADGERFGRIHDVEGKLTPAQWLAYDEALHRGGATGHLSPSYWAIHATAEQKIRALARVLREVPHAE